MVQIATITLVSGPPQAEVHLTRGNQNPTTILNAPSVTVALTRQVGDGPTGARGQTGPSGGESYVHHQNAAAALWVIAHNLERFPAVSVTDQSGEALLADHRYLDNNLVEVTFAHPTAGVAYLN